LWSRTVPALESWKHLTFIGRSLGKTPKHGKAPKNAARPGYPGRALHFYSRFLKPTTH
jgi:hypothetical protein